MAGLPDAGPIAYGCTCLPEEDLDVAASERSCRVKLKLPLSTAAPERGSVMAIVLMVLAAILLTAVVAQKFAGVALPGMTRARASTNEASAIAALRVINGAQAGYSSSCASGGFAVSLDDLAKPPGGQGVAFISSDLGKNGIEKNGYKITMDKDAKPGVVDIGTADATCNAAAANPASSYFVSAEPTTPGSSGVRYFAADARGIVYASDIPISNPIVESETVKPVQGGAALDKLGEKPTEKVDEPK